MYSCFMANLKRTTFIACVLFATWTIMVVYGYFIIGGGHLKAGIAVPTKLVDLDLYEITDLDLHDVPDLDLHEVPGLDLHDVPALDLHDVPKLSVHDVSDLDLHDVPDLFLYDVPELDLHDVSDLDLHDVPDLDLHDVPDLILHDVPDLDLHDVPDLSLYDVPDLDLHDVSDLDLHKVPDLDLQQVPQIKVNISSIDEICQSSDVKDFNGGFLQSLGTKSLEKNRSYFLFNATKVCFCAVQKAASTSVLRSLLIAEYPENAHHYETIAGSAIHGQPKLRNSRTTPRACSTGSKLSFLVTRDPYQRLFSAYIDKVFLEKMPGMAHKIKKSADSINQGNVLKKAKILSTTNKTEFCDATVNATLGDFVSYITKLKKLDPHFIPVTSLCNPCDYKFDLIMKQENMLQQMDTLMDYLNTSGVIKSKTDHVSDYSGMDGIQRTAATFYNFMLGSKCELTSTRHDALNRRLWDALKILGNIDDREEYNRLWFGIPTQYSTGTTLANLLVKRLEYGGIKALNRTQRDKQRQRHLIQAYSDVSDKLTQEIQRRYKLDFAIFGYDIEPPK